MDESLREGSPLIHSFPRALYYIQNIRACKKETSELKREIEECSKWGTTIYKKEGGRGWTSQHQVHVNFSVVTAARAPWRRTRSRRSIYNSIVLVIATAAAAYIVASGSQFIVYNPPLFSYIVWCLLLFIFHGTLVLCPPPAAFLIPIFFFFISSLGAK